MHGIEKGRVEQIEGLRAVCVLLVVVFHINPDVLPGGYLGVDAFFAISGYVITRMISRQYVNGSFWLPPV
jgi:peptidoglycan/LPS O-acetylase OafA/YrhL